MSGWTLQEALLLGRGIERPFRCEVHEGEGMHASVNVLKGVWYCYSCHAKGVVDSTRVPTADELLTMLEPEVAAREYAGSWLEVYGHGGYWLDRFPSWLCWLHSLGEDPWTGEATFPVHTPHGRLAGLGRRQPPGPGPRYLYPRSWSASRSLFGARGRTEATDLVVLVEGAADAAAMQQVGLPAFGLYGSGAHLPQIQMVLAMHPRLVLLALDADDAGRAGAQAIWEELGHQVPVDTVAWPEGSDPASLPPEQRMQGVIDIVGGGAYGGLLDPTDVALRAERFVEGVKTAYVEEAS